MALIEETLFGTEDKVAHGKNHGDSRTRLYRVWKSMRSRCYNPNRSSYKDYGGRGIEICDEWQDFVKFKEWAYKAGYDETAEYGKCTIDRIDNDGDYEPSNCRWVDRTVQNNNSRNNHYIEFNGEVKTLTTWAKDLGLTLSALRHRLDRGWTMEEIVATPMLPCRRDNLKSYYQSHPIDGQIALELKEYEE